MESKFDRMFSGLGLFVRRRKDMPLGLDVLHDLGRLGLLQGGAGVMLDVGANIGQTTQKFREAFPKSRIAAFEPSQATYQNLKANVGKDPQVTCEHLAVGSDNGVCKLATFDEAVFSRVVTGNGADAPGQETRNKHEVRGYEEVPMVTVDSYLAEKNMPKVDLLKIDTEGHEMAVLEGARQALATGKVAAVYMECTPTPLNTYHTSLAELITHMHGLGFYLLGLYEPNHWKVQISKPSRVFWNALFVRAAYVEGR